MAEVFISYSSTDRERVLRIVSRLSRRAVDCWVDRNKIPGGSDWSGEITRNIKACKALILMASARSLASPNVGNEIGLAVKFSKKILPLWIESNLEYPDNIAYDLNRIQHIVAGDDEAGEDDEDSWWRKLLDALRQANVSVPDDPAAQQNVRAATPAAAGATTALMPFLADRDQQERHILTALEIHVEQNIRRPILFLLHGDQSQCLDGFVFRLERSTLPRFLTRLKLPDKLEWKNIRWPMPPAGAPADPADEREQAYRAEVAKKLDLRLTATPAEIMQGITNYRQAVVFSSVIEGEHWQDNEPALLKRIIAFWSELPNSNTQPVIVFITITFPEQMKSILAFWRSRDRHPEIAQVRSLVAETKDANLDICMLPELTSISLAEVKDWVRDVVQPLDPDADPEVTLQRLEQAFDQQAPGSASLPMKQLLPILRSLLPATVALRGA